MSRPVPPTAHALSRRERQIMDVLYHRGRATVGEVLADLGDPPSYSAVRALLRVLEEKGHVRHEAEGRAYVYRPAVPRDRARQSAVRHLVRTFFDGSVAQAVAALLDPAGPRPSPEDLDHIACLVEQAKREGR